MFNERETLYLSIVVILCALFLIGLSYYFYRHIKTYDDYNVAGRSAGTFPLICTLVGTAVGGSTLLGFMSKGFQQGVGQIWLPGAITIAGVLLLLFFVRRIRDYGERYSMITLADFMVKQYGDSARLPTLLSMICAYSAITGMQFVAIATVLNLVFGLELAYGIVITWLILTIKTYLGGLKAVIWSDAILGTLQTLGVFFLLAVVYHLAGGWGGITDSEKLTAQPHFLEVSGIAPSDLFVYLLTIGGYQFVRQDLWQRFWAAKNAQAAYSSYAVAVVFTMLIGGAAVLIGVFASLGLNIQLDNPDLTFYAVLEATLPLPLIILMIVVLLSTVVSCADSFFIAGASSIANDIIKPRLKNQDDRFLLRMSRYSVLVMSVISVGLALYAPRLVTIWILGSAMLVCGVLVPALVGLLFDNLNRRAGVATMWAGLVSAVAWQALGQPFGVHPVFIGLPISLLMLPLLFRGRDPEPMIQER
ncbi:Na+/proline symporter [Modicisalibacter ilicicola DSM 19980]|uniref:Na+/proline symporter n=1 Tax=Modicisalibacter ilicicola DSM 19980 TaxID=1121942 RepID=A0A1M5B2S2_9GAMM|nr:sodium:solute symporter family protein [Halomonas ilicicola]SHF36482.1 Na+/proline symporter [Halomonas ilicicola DSM 19980]